MTTNTPRITYHAMTKFGPFYDFPSLSYSPTRTLQIGGRNAMRNAAAYIWRGRLNNYVFTQKHPLQER